MPEPKIIRDVHLDICDDPRILPYKQATGPDGSPIRYWYRFTGGSDDQGSMRVSKSEDGDSKMTILSSADRIYTMQSLRLLDNGAPVLPDDPYFKGELAADGYSCTITNLISKRAGQPTHDYYYQITLRDSRNGQLIVADPTIQNRPL